MNELELILAEPLFGVVLLAVVVIAYRILRSPFQYPYFRHEFDVSGKRQPKFEDLIDQYINDNGIEMFEVHYKKVQQWKLDCQKQLERAILKNLRQKQYDACLNDNGMFQFVLVRQQTRYRQMNYQKISYKAAVYNGMFCCNYQKLVTRYRMLKEIGFQCTINEYHSKNQRKLMTKALRKKIMIRDNYTCRICGKYMPDEVGLHIDHIIPVSKGGKTIESNLQVLCSKCNGRKSNRF